MNMSSFNKFSQFNWYFYKVQIPLTALWVWMAYDIVYESTRINWLTVFSCWFAIGILGIGVGYHRLLSHRQFNTTQWMENILILLGTLSFYAPSIFFVSYHQYHHKNSDAPNDISSPRHFGILKTFFISRMTLTALDCNDINNYCFRQIIKNSFARWASKNFVLINYSWLLFLFLVFGKVALFNLALIPILIEHLRVNIVSSLSHVQMPLSYRNHDINDDSYNHIIWGLLTFGFGWHNNHHRDERKLILQEHWWEIDIEGYLGRLLTLSKSRKDSNEL